MKKTLRTLITLALAISVSLGTAGAKVGNYTGVEKVGNYTGVESAPTTPAAQSSVTGN